MAVPLVNIKITDITAELDLADTNMEIEDIFLSPNVVATGLDYNYCNGLNDLRTRPYSIDKFRNYEKPTTVTTLYGNLYNGYVALNPNKSIAPIDPLLDPSVNWRVPTYEDLTYFKNYPNSLGKFINAYKLDKILTGTPITNHPGWLSPNISAENWFDFRGVATGRRSHDNQPLFDGTIGTGDFEAIGEALYLLSSTATTYLRSGTNYPAVWIVDMRYNADGSKYKTPKTWGYSIRCCRNYIPGYDILPYQPIQDFEGNYYEVIKIGNRMWMQSDMRTGFYNDGSSIPLRQSKVEWLQNTTMHAYCVNEF